MSLLTKILGDPNKKELAKMGEMVDLINGLEKQYEGLSDGALKAKTDEFRERCKQGESLDSLLPEAFAAVREAAKRTIGQRPYDVQILAGITLHRGMIAEMKTGEGKTLAATLPLYLNALTGKGAHLVTVNDYLATLHAEWMGHIFHALGMTTGCIQQQGLSYLYSPSPLTKGRAGEGSDNNEQNEINNPSHSKGEEVTKVEIEEKNLKAVERQQAYAADVTYGTNNEFGFDYLRDNMAQSLAQKTQRELAFAIVDEVDSIFIDEARTPLIISAPAQEAADQYYQFARIVPRLSEGEDYNVDEKMRAATLTDEGISKVEKELGVENLYVEGGIKLVHHLENALRAHALFKRDKDYVVREGEVVIVDEFTGRLMFGRRYSDGLHQALEAKENVKIQQESVTMATITFQNYFRLYEKLSGMTGTAKTEEEEFAKIYGLSVLEIPTNRPLARVDRQDKVYKTEDGKFKAVIEEIRKKNELGQPVLVGTASVEKNEKLSSLLNQAGVKYEMLNAKNHEREAQIIAQAGQVGAVTVATNMAGRGVDIILGGNPPDEEQAKAVRSLGGLAVIGTERHESRRIDNQLRGRSGRQGDPGDSQFFISVEDDLMRIFGSDRMKSVMDRLGVPDDMPIENKLISKSIESAQKKVEGHNFDARKHVVQYDDVINKHREVIYGMRNVILSSPLEGEGREGSDTANNTGQDQTSPSPSLARRGTKEKILDMIAQEISEVVNFHAASDNQDDWNLDEIYEVVDTIYPVPLEVRLKLEDIFDQVQKDSDHLKGREALIYYLTKLSRQEYEKMEQSFSETATAQALAGESEQNPFRRVESSVLLRSIDTLWVEHIDAMDHLRQGIGLRGYGQRDPLVEYKKEARAMFDRLLASIRKQTVYSIYKVGHLANSNIQMPPQDLSGAKFTGAAKTSDQGTAQFSGVSGTTPQAMSAQSSTLGGGQSAAVERFVRKKQGAKQSPVVGTKKKIGLPAEASAKVGRNDPCPCGAINEKTGKVYKYKQCGLINAPHHNK